MGVTISVPGVQVRVKVCGVVWGGMGIDDKNGVERR